LNIFNVLKSLFIWYNDVTAFLSQGPSSWVHSVPCTIKVFSL
jgi:hypothetical protein